MSIDYELEAKVTVLEGIIHKLMLPIWRGFTPEDVRQLQIESLKPHIPETGSSNVDKGRAELVGRELQRWIGILEQVSQPFPGNLLAPDEASEDTIA